MVFADQDSLASQKKKYMTNKVKSHVLTKFSKHKVHQSHCLDSEKIRTVKSTGSMTGLGDKELEHNGETNVF